MTTTIEWTDETWNPVSGCSKVSEGCRNCYAERVFPRVYGQDESLIDGSSIHTIPVASLDRDRADGLVRKRRFSDVRTHPERLDAPLHWRKPRRVFVNSMSDLFHEAVPDAFLDDVFSVMGRAREHTFQILTKRPVRMKRYLDKFRIDGEGYVTRHGQRAMGAARGPIFSDHRWPLPSVWLGVSCEDQATADARIPILLQTPAAVRFVSLEPLLGPIDIETKLDTILTCNKCGFADRVDRSSDGRHARRTGDGEECGYLGSKSAGLNWVIVGGESGPKARPCDVAWIRSIVEQCKAAGVPCFVKQLGARVVSHPECGGHSECGCQNPYRLELRHRKGADPAEWPEDLRVREFPQP